MASYSDAFGFTPQQFLQLTLPQLADFAEYAKKRDEDTKRQSKPQSGFSSSGTGTKTSLDQMVAQFGTKKAKAELLNNG
jgi:hypothetical protein